MLKLSESIFLWLIIIVRVPIAGPALHRAAPSWLLHMGRGGGDKILKLAPGSGQ